MIKKRFILNEKETVVSIMYRGWMKEFIQYVQKKLDIGVIPNAIVLTGPQGNIENAIL